jgi:Holliday junction resolvase RusA-like endonuclease
MPVVEFIVEEVPVSHQTRSKPSLQAWKALVRSEAAKVWHKAPLAGNLKVVIMNFFDGADPPCDDDNMAKPIRDALNRLVYNDDSQITHSEHVQISNNTPFRIRGASKIVVDALREEKEFVYVRIEDAPAQTQLPR